MSSNKLEAQVDVTNPLLERVRPFFDDAKDQLESTRHFGVLAGALKDADEPCRADYVILHCALLRQLKEAVPGLGLGSSNGLPAKIQGQPDVRQPKEAIPGSGLGSSNGLPAKIQSQPDVWAPLRGLSKLEICQLWAVLLNSGHLWGTFATERGLFFELDRNLEYREQFVSSSIDFDQSRGNELRAKFEDALDTVHLHRFHYLLAFWRLRDGGPSTLKENERNMARLLLKLFFMMPTDSMKSLAEIFRKTRQLIYLGIHNKIKKSKHQIRDADDSELKLLFPLDALPEGDWASRGRWDVLSSIDRHDANELFGSSVAAAHVLAHVESFKDWWRVRDGKGNSFASRIDDLFRKPDDWTDRTPATYTPFADLRIPSGVDWLGEVRLWLRNDAMDDPWGRSNFLIASSPQEPTLRVDIYRTEEGLATRTLEHVVAQLTRAFGGANKGSESNSLWMSSSRLIARAFESCLSPGFSLRLRPVRGADGHVGYACLGSTYEFVRGLAKKFLPTCKDLQRAIEIRQTITVVDKMSIWRRPSMLMLASAEVVREHGSEVVAEIDGLLGVFVNGGLKWIIVETKKANSQDGERQLRDHLEPALISPLSEVKRFKYRGQDAWFAEIESPPLLR